MTTEQESLKQFRLDIIEALSHIDVEIEALHRAIVEKEPVTPERLKEIRSDSRKILHKFRDHHAQHISAPHESR